jgi:hypothetical protein
MHQAVSRSLDGFLRPADQRGTGAATRPIGKYVEATTLPPLKLQKPTTPAPIASAMK